MPVGETDASGVRHERERRLTTVLRFCARWPVLATCSQHSVLAQRGMGVGEAHGDALLAPTMRRPRTTEIGIAVLFLCVGLVLGFSTGSYATGDDLTPKVDFEFQIKGINTTRQLNKTMDVYVRWRYKPGTNKCPWSPTDNTCIQYQLGIHAGILDLALRGRSGLELTAEWERVNLAICEGIWGNWSTLLSALSTAVHVNGDGRSAAERGPQPYEPGAHGSVCTIGTGIQPVELPNHLPNYGAI